MSQSPSDSFVLFVLQRREMESKSVKVVQVCCQTPRDVLAASD